MEQADVAIIGGGVAGLSAAMYARRFNLNVILFDAFFGGGSITKTDRVENYPGFANISGLDLIEKIKEHAVKYKPKIVNKFAEKIEIKNKKFIISCEEEKYEAEAVIFATGTKNKKLGIKGEEEFAMKGVHYCALCDGNFYKNKAVAVVGAGDRAVKEAVVLSKIAKNVFIIARKENVHPEESNLQLLKEAKNIEVIPYTEIMEIIGDKKVNKVLLNKEYNNSKELFVEAVFVAIGYVPISEIAMKLGVKTNKKGEIITDKFTKTNLPGFFAAGDVTDTEFKQAITGAAEGCIAAFSAYEYIAKGSLERF